MCHIIILGYYLTVAISSYSMHIAQDS